MPPYMASASPQQQADGLSLLTICFIRVSLFIGSTVVPCPCPEGSMGQLAGGRRRADDLAAVVDAQSFAEGATGQSAEVDHCPVFK